MAVAVVPARGGSVAVPAKNLQRVGGLSLVARTVRTARAAGADVVVSTDSAEIAGEARAHGASVVDRPPELSGGLVTSEAVLLHALAELGDAGAWFWFLQCTSPFLAEADMRRVAAPVAAGVADVAFTAAEFHGYIWQADDDGARGVNFDPFAGPALPRQQRPAQWLETGAAYAISTEGFRRTGRRFFGRVVPVECETWRGVDVDAPADLEAARALAPVLDR